jgi:hypothetical protein
MNYLPVRAISNPNFLNLFSTSYTGENYIIDPRPPLTKRGCTDKLILLVLMLFFSGMIFIGYRTLQDGDPDKLFYSRDDEGHYCGKTPGYEEYPY